jgi:hypothetical protein
MKNLRNITLTRQQLLLLVGVVIAIICLILFGFRFGKRVVNPPDQEPIRGWMSIPYVSRVANVPPWVLYKALGVEDEIAVDIITGAPLRKDTDERFKPIAAHARDLNITPQEAVRRIEDRIKQGPPYPPPPIPPANLPPPNPTPSK